MTPARTFISLGLLDASIEPGYDAVAYRWAFPQAHPPKVDRPSDLEENDDDEREPGVDDASHLLRLRATVGNWSLGLCTVFVFILLVGQFAFNRTVGPYVIMNIVCALVFGGGALTLRLQERTASLRFLQLYFAFITLSVVIGVPLGIYQLTNNAARVDSFCAERTAGVCTADERSNFLAFAHVVSIVGLFSWFVLATLFMRCLFVLLCAVERADHQETASAMHPAVLAVASWMPNYPAMWRWLLTQLRAVVESPNWSVYCDPRAIGAALATVALFIVFLPIALPALAYLAGGESWGPVLCAVLCIAEICVWIWMNALCRSTGSWIACTIDIWVQVCLIILDTFGKARN